VAPKPKSSPPGKSKTGDLIWRARYAMGFTEQAFANACGVGREVINRLEHGSKKGTTYAQLEALAKGFGVDVESVRSLLTESITLEDFAKRRLEKSGKVRNLEAQKENQKLQRLIDRLRLTSESVRILTGTDSRELETLGGLPHSIRQAALAAVHLVEDANLDEAIVAAERAYLELGAQMSGPPLIWVQPIVERMHKQSRTRKASKPPKS
jgi:transcriptional regulator with XRE-family HTH domain